MADKMNPYFNNVCDRYQESDVLLSSPEGLVTLLYVECLCRLVVSKEAFLMNDLTAMNKNIAKSISIIAELLGALNMEEGGQISDNLAVLYEYIAKNLFLLRREQTIELFDEMIHLITPLKEGWGMMAISNKPLQMAAK